MQTLTDYQILEKIYETSRTLVCKAQNAKGQTVIIKTLRESYPELKDLSRLRHEYEIIKKLPIAGIVTAFELIKHQNNLLLVLEDFGGISLREFMNHRKIDLEMFFRIAIEIVEALLQIHAHGVVHKDINLRNILINPESLHIRIIDFSLASFLSNEKQAAVNPDLLEGTFPYLSPEQTGRMNREIDYRSDFYSLGISFFELLTDKLPYYASDSMGWVHCHIAKEAPAPATLRPDLPETLGRILLKMMAKKAEDRYQSAAGLLADLKTCQRQWNEDGKIDAFELATDDFSEKFQIPQKLYGREEETLRLQECFFRTLDGTCEMLLVAGYSGIGKSSLINEIHKPLVEKYGFFIGGKFDQFQRHIPYAAFSSAFGGLVRQLLAEPESRLLAWKDRLLDALVPNAQVIIDVIPELEWLIGSQPSVPELGTEENQQRFVSVFQEFVKIFTARENPLVMFLDDLQWADTASLRLMHELLCNDDNAYLLFMGAYRDNEVDDSHPFMLTVADIKKSQVKVNEITLKPLALHHLELMLQETLHTEVAKVHSLARLVMDKTAGNPFFVIQFLKNLHHEQLIRFDASTMRWCWDMAHIQSQNITDNVVELMLRKLRKLPPKTQELLKLAACIGNVVDLKILAIISRQALIEVAEELWIAVTEGLLLPLGDGHHLLTNLYEAYNTDDLPDACDRFLHDRVQQAAYSLIDDADKSAVHLKIGRLLLQDTSQERLDARLFDIVEHLNKSIALIDDEHERLQLAELNLQAGQKSQASTAYRPALEFFECALEALPDDAFRRHPALAFSVHKGRLACLFLAGNSDEGIRAAETLLTECGGREQVVEINNILILHYGGAGQMDKAIDIALDSLELYGVRLPRDPNRQQLLLELADTKLKQRGKGIEELKKMPQTKDADVIHIFSLLKELVAPTYLQGKLLLPYIILRMFKLTLIHGNSQTSSFVYSAYGLLWSKLGFPKQAHKYGKLAMDYNRFVDNPPMEARCHFMVTSFCMFWKQPFKDTREPRKQGLQKLLNTGESFWASYIYLFGFWQEVFIAEKLDDVVQFADREMKYARKVQQTEPYHAHKLHRNLFKALAGDIVEPLSLDVDEGDERQALEHIRINVTSTCGRFNQANCRLILHFFNQDYRVAAEIAIDDAITEEVINEPTFTQPVYTFFTCLAILCAFDDLPKDLHGQYLKILGKRQKKLQQWQRCCPENFSAMADLVAAEKGRVEHDDAAAICAYRKAIAAAETMESLFLKALSNELYARFWMQRQDDRLAKVYLSESHYFYKIWGMQAKADDIEKRYPALLQLNEMFWPKSPKSWQQTHSVSATSSTTTQSLDSTSVIKASLAIANEIRLDRLQNQLMEILIENAGAQRGVLILNKDGELIIQAEGEVDKPTRSVEIPLKEADNLPHSLINCIVKAEKPEVLENAAITGNFVHDPYIAREKSKSLMAMPIINQGRLVGVLYLENNLLENAFTSKRLELLQVLSSQIAISVENAVLYETLEQKVKERTQELEQSQRQLVESEKMAALGGLVAGVAHEINTPVGIGVTAASSLETMTQKINRLYKEEELTTEDLEDYLQSMTEGSKIILKNLGYAAEQIKSFKMVAIDQSTEEKREFRLKSYIEEILLSLHPKLKKTRIRVEIVCPGDLVLNSYPGAFSQAITNLVINSLIHAYDKDERGIIRICVTVEGDNMLLEYSDDGKGIEEKDLKNIFNPFFTTNRKAGGSGLGMHILYNLVSQKLKGTIRCSSKPKEGVLFRMIIPLNPDANVSVSKNHADQT